MSLPVIKKELLCQPDAASTVKEERYGLPDSMLKRDAESKAGGGSGHALQAVEEAHPLESLRQDLAFAKRMFGSQLAQQLVLEMRACSQVGRLDGGVASSRSMISNLTGEDEYMTAGDFLRRPDDDVKVVDASTLILSKRV